MSKLVIGEMGDRCPRCGRGTEVWTHEKIRAKQRAAPFYYRKWFRCGYSDCGTTLIMPPRFRVWNGKAVKRIRARNEARTEELVAESEQLGGYTDGPPPWE
jgi:hypothetical protein